MASTKGIAIIDGVKKDVAMWLNKEKKYFSIKFSEPYKKEDLPETDLGKDDDLPF